MRGPRAAVPPRRGEECRYQEGAHKAPGRRGAPGVPGTTRGGHPIAPTKPLSAGPHAGVPAWPPERAGAGCGIRPSGGGSGPRGQRRRTADPTGRLPPGIWFQAWPAAIRPQTPAVPGAKRPPGFRRSDDGHSGGEPGGARRRRRRSSIGGGVGHEVTQGTSPGEGIGQAGKGPPHPIGVGLRGTQHAGGGGGVTASAGAWWHINTLAVGRGRGIAPHPFIYPPTSLGG